MNDYLLLLLIGIFGSIHCVGFCGPILVTLNIRAARNDIRSRLIFTLQYNAGRILTYSILGGLAGIIGGGIIHSASFAWLQGGVAFIAGAFMVYVGLALLHILPGGKLLEGEAILNLPYIKGFFGLLSGMAKFGGFFEGMLMGLIPCGMVYAVLMKAIAAGNPLEGWLLMSSFGLGTMVAMILIGLINKEILNRRILNIAYLLIVLIGMVTIIRGINPMPHHLDLEPSAQGPLSLVSWAFRHIFSPENLMMILYGLGLLLGSLGIYLFGRELGVRLKMRHKRYLWINEDLCEGCDDCIEKSGCLNLRHVETEYGRKARIHYPYCRQSYACLAGECPSFLVIDLPPGRAPRPKRNKIPSLLGMLPDPSQRVYPDGRYNTDSHSTGYQGGEEEATQAYSASKASVEGEAPSGFAGGGGDASPYDRRADDEANAGSRMKANPYKILIAGVDSVAVAQVSGLLNMAATMEGRLGYTPGAYALSGEGETVISPCVISDGFIENPDDYETDLILGLDLAAAANASTLTTLPSTKTNVVVNRGMISTTTPSPLFLNQVQDKLSPRSGGGVMESGKMEEQDRLIEEIDSSIRSDNILYLDAGYLAERIMGDQQMSHLFILGFAYQAGLLPVKVSSLEEAIHQDGGVAAQEMVSALEWGRIYYLSPHMALEEIEADHWSKKDPKERTISKLKMERPSAIPEFEKILSEIKVEDRGLKILLYPRIADLILYQDSLYAREYVRSVMSVMGREKEVVKDRLDLTMAVARSLFKLMAYKDEYEAARLHLTRANRERIASVFGKEAKVFWSLRPPWSKNKSLLGGWFMPVLSILASLRWMRRYRINPFGSSPIRRMEQDLPSWYREVIDTLILELHQGNYPLAVRIASSPDKISGYGMVKIASIKEVISEVERDLSFLNGEDLSDIEPLYEEASAN